MRCPSCNKFPAFEIAEPELNLGDVEHGVLCGDVRLLLTTECCGDEAKDSNFDIELDMTDDILDALKAAGVENPDLDIDGIDYEVVSEAASGDERYESTNAKGKPINPRYQKKFYTVDVEVSIKVTYPMTPEPVVVTVDGNYHDETQASAMEELC